MGYYPHQMHLRSGNDTFTILKRNDVKDFLQNLNAQQPTFRLEMETENKNKISFLDT